MKIKEFRNFGTEVVVDTLELQQVLKNIHYSQVSLDFLENYLRNKPCEKEGIIKVIGEIRQFFKSNGD